MLLCRYVCMYVGTRMHTYINVYEQTSAHVNIYGGFLLMSGCVLRYFYSHIYIHTYILTCLPFSVSYFAFKFFILLRTISFFFFLMLCGVPQVIRSQHWMECVFLWKHAHLRCAMHFLFLHSTYFYVYMHPLNSCADINRNYITEKLYMKILISACSTLI